MVRILPPAPGAPTITIVISALLIVLKAGLAKLSTRLVNQKKYDQQNVIKMKIDMKPIRTEKTEPEPVFLNTSTPYIQEPWGSNITRWTICLSTNYPTGHTT